MLRGKWTVGKGVLRGEVSLFDWKPTDFPKLENKAKTFVELTDLYVHPNRRGQGWAKVLVEAALKYANRYAWPVIIRIHPYGPKRLDNDSLIKFYKKFGFKQLERGSKYYYILWPGDHK